MGFGPLRGDLGMLLPSTGVPWIQKYPNSQKYPQNRTVKQTGKKDFVAEPGFWVWSACTTGVPVGWESKSRSMRQQAPRSPFPTVVLCRSLALGPSQLFWSQLQGLFLLGLVIQ